ncbi:MAG: hypothetical protein ABW184_10895 [Sphingobium sp.]
MNGPGNQRSRDPRRELRDYPISLRQSARAVFGSEFAREEEKAADEQAKREQREPEDA